MKFERCDKGHLFDADKYLCCPHCASSTKEQQLEIFEDTINRTKFDPALVALTERAKKETVLYTEGFRSEKRSLYTRNEITVIESNSFDAAKKLCAEYERVAVLNFASAVNPGGGVTVGAIAQEECLCRTSNLYPCLNQPHLWDEFYTYHRSQSHKDYSDRIIYSAGVTVFKTDTDFPQYTNNWFTVDVITSSAPNLIGVEKPDWYGLTALFTSRIRSIFEVAMENNVQALVLGAFGCGAFKNPPELVSGIFKDILENEGYKEHFSKIVFAIKRSNELYCDNLAQFERTFYTTATHLRMPSGIWLKGDLLSEYAQYAKKNALAEKKISILGDSLSTLERNNPDGHEVFYKGENCKKSRVECFSDTWWGQVISFFGSELLVNNSFAGCRIWGNNPSAGGSDERTGGLHKGNTNPDVVFIFLGLNDNADHLYIAYDSMLQKVKKNYPQAEIWCAALYQSRVKGSEKSLGSNLQQRNEAIECAANKNKCRFLDYSRHDCDPLAYESFDGIHPSKRGMEQLACMFIREIDEKAADKYLSCADGKHQLVFPGMVRVYYQGNDGLRYETHYRPVCEKCAFGNGGKSNKRNRVLCEKYIDGDGDKPIKNEDQATTPIEKTYVVRLSNNEQRSIRKPDFNIGRDSIWADFVISDNQLVSRRHATIRQKGNDWVLCDLESSNGTYLNGERILPGEKIELISGTEIRIADENFIFYC